MSHLRSPRPDYPETNGVSGTTRNLRIIADGHSSASGLTENVVCKLYGQDFDFRDSSQGSLPPFFFAENENFNVVDAMNIANRARALQARELRRLFHAAMNWSVDAAEQSMDMLRPIVERVAIHIRSIRRWRAQRRAIDELRRLNDRTLQDIGIARSQIESVGRGNTELYRRPHAPAPRRQVE